MTRRKLSESDWERLIAEQASSELTPSEYCRENDLKATTFYKWRKRLSEGSGFKELPLVEPSSKKNSIIRLNLPCGITVTIESEGICQ
jgi:transposase-like protein